MTFVNAVAWAVIVAWLWRATLHILLQMTETKPMALVARDLSARRTSVFWFVGAVVAALWLIFG